MMLIFPQFTMIELTLMSTFKRKQGQYFTQTADVGLNFNSDLQLQCKFKTSNGDIISSS